MHPRKATASYNRKPSWQSFEPVDEAYLDFRCHAMEARGIEPLTS